jgi:hypothetical protein
MIRINLLKGQVSKTVNKKFNITKIVVFILLVIIIAGSFTTALWIFKDRLFAKKEVVKKEYVVKEDAIPSTYSKEGIVEDVVKEVSSLHDRISEDGMLNLPYEELNLSEKISYEILFGKKIIELFGRTVPASIGLRTLEFDNFKTIYASGLSSSKELIEQFFVALKKENVKLLPKPLTVIMPNSQDGYKFVVTGEVNFSLNMSDSIIECPVIQDRELNNVLSTFDKKAKANSLMQLKSLTLVSSVKTGEYYRYIYEWSGRGSYKNFAKLVFDISRLGKVFAFKRATVTALSSSAVKIDLQLLITTTR